MRLLMDEDYKLTFADDAGHLLVTEGTSGITGVLEMQTFATTDDWQETALVCFEKGWVRVDLPPPLAAQRAGRVTVFDNSGKTGFYSSPILPNLSAMRNQAANFIRALAGKKNTLCPSSEAVKDLEIAVSYIDMRR